VQFPQHAKSASEAIHGYEIIGIFDGILFSGLRHKRFASHSPSRSQREFFKSNRQPPSCVDEKVEDGAQLLVSNLPNQRKLPRRKEPFQPNIAA